MNFKNFVFNVYIIVCLLLISSCIIYVDPPKPQPDTSPPSVTVSSPRALETNGCNIIIKGTASDPSGINKVYVTADGLNYTNEVTGLDGTAWSAPLTLANEGLNTIRVWAADSKGNVSSPVSVVIIADFQMPSIIIENPSDGSYVGDNPLEIYGSASVSNDTITQIRLSTNGGTNYYFTAAGTASWSNSTPINAGVNAIKAQVITSGGKTNETPLITFTYRQTKWNILVYMEASGLAANLEQFALYNFNEMENVPALTNGKVNIIVLFSSAGFYTGWSGARLYQIKYDPTGMNNVIQSKRLSGTINGVNLTTTGENQYLDMGDTNTLKDFVVWATNNYQASNSMMILWDHGDGWSTGAPLLNTTVNSLVNLPFKGACGLLNSEIRWALNGKGLTVLGFDACLMGMLEAAYEFKDLAKYLIVSPDLEFAYGWNYDDWLARFCASDLTPETLVSNVIDSYHSYYNSISDTTLAAYKLTNFNQLTNAFEYYLTYLTNELWNYQHINKSILHKSNFIYNIEQYNDDLIAFFHTDIWDMADQLGGAGSSDLKIAVTNFVYYEWHHSSGDIFNDNPRSHGLALYFSPAKNDLILDSAYINNPGIFFTKTKWVDYLTNLYYFPPYQWLSNLQIVNSNTVSNGSVNFQFFVTNTGFVTINLTNLNLICNNDLYLYKDSSVVTQSINIIGRERITVDLSSTGWYIINVTNVTYNSPNNYILSLSNTGGPGAGIR